MAGSAGSPRRGGGRKWFSTSVWRCPWRSSGYAPVYVSGAVSVRPARSWITRVAVAGSGASSACWSMACVVTFAAALLARAASVSFVLVTLVAVVLSSGVASGRAPPPWEARGPCRRRAAAGCRAGEGWCVSSLFSVWGGRSGASPRSGGCCGPAAPAASPSGPCHSANPPRLRPQRRLGCGRRQRRQRCPQHRQLAGQRLGNRARGRSSKQARVARLGLGHPRDRVRGDGTERCGRGAV
ncbi:hypothetical protein BH24GEM3_BH24GEM3_20970 [soil metagenome]